MEAVKISIVSPVYRTEKIIPELVRRVSEEVSKISDNFEIILVEDGSPDNSWQVIEKICAENKKIKGISLSRNFGQHYAVTAGVNKATGDFIVIMDCDLQDNPADIALLYQKFKEGNEIVFTRRKNRQHGFFKRLNSRIYNLLFRIFSERQYDVNAGSLVGFGKNAREAFSRFPDKDRLYLQILKWIGFRSTYVEVEHQPRFEGKSSYNYFKLFHMALQGWTSHSDKMLKFSIYIGFFMAFLSFLLGLTIIYRYFVENLQPGWPSIIVAILFSTGLILISIGIAGIYIGKTFEQAKNRPLYIIQKELN